MKRFLKVFSIILSLFLVVGLLVSCNEDTPTQEPEGEVDYVSQLKFDDTSSNQSKWSTATVRNYVDGDTTHFDMPDGVIDHDYLKARYLAINTPESTGQIEPWGKAASNFTKSKLSEAESIIIESDDANWNLDSTGGRYLVWVWYRTSEQEDYRNLNLEILQNGLAIASNTARNKYGDICTKALNQAKNLKLKVHSSEQDPDYYYGEAINVSLKALRLHPEEYVGKRVAFEAIVTKNYNNTLNVEIYDEELQMYIGMQAYLGYSMSGAGLEIVANGNKVLFVGSFQYYATGGTYQLADLKYQAMRPNDPSNIKLISSGHQPGFAEVTIDQIKNGKVVVEEVNEETSQTTKTEVRFAAMAMNSSVSLKNLVVTHVSTTTNEESSSQGAMTLTCQSGNATIKVRTVVLTDKDGNLITADYFEGKTIDVNGYIDFYMDEYQIKLFSLNDVVVK